MKALYSSPMHHPPQAAGTHHQRQSFGQQGHLHETLHSEPGSRARGAKLPASHGGYGGAGAICRKHRHRAVLDCRAPQHEKPGQLGHLPADSAYAGAHPNPARRLWRRHAAQPQPVCGGRAVRHAGNAVSRAGRTGAGACARHRYAHCPRLAPRAECLGLSGRNCRAARLFRQQQPGIGVSIGRLERAVLHPRLQHRKRLSGRRAGLALRLCLALCPAHAGNGSQYLPPAVQTVGAPGAALCDGGGERHCGGQR